MFRLNVCIYLACEYIAIQLYTYMHDLRTFYLQHLSGFNQRSSTTGVYMCAHMHVSAEEEGSDPHDCEHWPSKF